VIAAGSDVISHLKRIINEKMLLNVTFGKFLTYIVKGGFDVDNHWKLQIRCFRICNYAFDFLGRFEALSQDANKIFRYLHLELQLPEEIDCKQKTVDMLHLCSYYKQILKHLLQSVFSIYKDEFLAFGYNPNKFF